jgi:hypothetical protein
VAKALIGAALLVAVTGLAVAIAAYREARQATDPPTYAEITAAAVRDFRRRRTG